MASRPFQVLILTGDRKTLRRLSKFLDAFGYVVREAAEVEQAVASLEARRPDFLIIDASLAHGGGLQLCRATRGDDQNSYTYTFLLVRNPGVDMLTNALEAGIDDFLSKPIIYGELLARLRAGARAIEFENRLRTQAPIDHVTGLPSRAIFANRLRTILESPENKPRSLACVMIDLDFFRRIRQTHGRAAAEGVLRFAAEQLQNWSESTECFASLGKGRFGALLPDKTESEAVDWAEKIRRDFAELDFPLGDAAVQLTASFGVVVAGSDSESLSAEEVLDQADRALRLAKHSGRNCVAVDAECRSETAEWTDLAADGKLFESTAVRDVMLPCPLMLHSGDTVRHSLALLDQSQLDEAPVVDDEGNLVGLATRSLLEQDSHDTSRLLRPVGEVISTEACSFEEAASFTELMDHFIDRPDTPLVALRDGKPAGVLYCSNLASLSEPLDTGSFASQTGFGSTTDHLLVPETCA